MIPTNPPWKSTDRYLFNLSIGKWNIFAWKFIKRDQSRNRGDIFNFFRGCVPNLRLCCEREKKNNRQGYHFLISFVGKWFLNEDNNSFWKRFFFSPLFRDILWMCVWEVPSRRKSAIVTYIYKKKLVIKEMNEKIQSHPFRWFFFRLLKNRKQNFKRGAQV